LRIQWVLSATSTEAVPTNLQAMHLRVTFGTERDQILVGIVSSLASILFVVDLKLHLRPANLASPAVPLQNLSTELLVGFQI
jgi:hypothetical protein